MANAFIDILALLGDARRLPLRPVTIVTTHAHGVETTTFTSTIFAPTTIVTVTTEIVTIDFVTTISYSRTSRVRP